MAKKTKVSGNKKKVTKKVSKPSKISNSKSTKKKETKSNSNVKLSPKQPVVNQTLLIANERDAAMDFATKVYKEFDNMIKSIVLFGSSAKMDLRDKSDIDIIILLDDVSINFDEELISWYRKRLSILLSQNKYERPLHINTVRLSTWWSDLIKGDPVVLNVLRYGEALIDFGGYFNPLRILLKEGKIKSTPESIYTLLQRAPMHLARANSAMLSVVDGVYWSMVDSAQAVLIAANIIPASPESIPEILNQHFVTNKLLDKKYVRYYETIYDLSKEIVYGKKTIIEGKYLDDLFKIANDFLREMSKLVGDIVRQGKN
ncbi:MAG: nucleotidyltransferase domain-containing protein [Candidatus Pacearchaeota archaeon]